MHEHHVTLSQLVFHADFF